MRVILSIALVLAPGFAVPRAQAEEGIVFHDDFENGLDDWAIHGADVARVIDSGDPDHGRVLALVPNGDALVWLPESERWGAVRMEGEFLFPSDVSSYLGFAYAIRKRGQRFDFGLIYVKSPDSYLQVNPHRDFNVGRLLYPEYHVPLQGESAIVVGEWQKFAVEVSGRTCHVYIGDMNEPRVTFSDLELNSGPIGLQPRSVGSEVLIDDVTVTKIDGLSWSGRGHPDMQSEVLRPHLTWQVAGPFETTRDGIARDPGDYDGWRPFETDDRGAVVTGRVVDTHGPRTVAYFRTNFSSTVAGRIDLHVSSVDDLAVWVNGRFHWFIPRGRAAWFDFGQNSEHAGTRIPIDIREGINEVVIRVRGGVYASGGFYARFEQPEARPGD